MADEEFVKPYWCGQADDCPSRDPYEMVSWRSETGALTASPDCQCKLHAEKQQNEVNNEK